jgi:hypothetical protein
MPEIPSPIDVRLPEAAPDPQGLLNLVRDVRAIVGGSGPLLNETQTRSLWNGGLFHVNRIPATQQPLSPESIQLRVANLEDPFLQAAANGNVVQLQSVWQLADARSQLLRVRAWDSVHSTPNALEAEAQRKRFQEIAQGIDQRQTLILYQDALLHDFLRVTDDYARFCLTPGGAAIRNQELQRPGSIVALRERRMAGMLREMLHVIPLLRRIAQFRFYRAMLEEDSIAQDIRQINLPAHTTINGQQRATDDCTLNELHTAHPNNVGLTALWERLPISMRTYRWRAIRSAYRTLEQQVPNEQMRLQIAPNGNIRQTLTARAQALQKEIVAGAQALRSILPERAAVGALPVDITSLAALQTGLQANASDQNIALYADHLDKRLRDMFRIGEGGENGQQATRIANNAYLSLLSARTDQLFTEMNNGLNNNRINIAQLSEMHDLYGATVDQIMDYHGEELSLSGQLLGLLVTQRHIGPGSRTQQLSAFMEGLNPRQQVLLTNVLGPGLMGQLLNEHTVYEQGINNYLTAIENACREHGQRVNQILQWFMGKLDGFSQILQQLVKGAHRFAWWLPDNTLVGPWARRLLRENGATVIDPEVAQKALGEWQDEIRSLRSISDEFLTRSEGTRLTIRGTLGHLQTLQQRIPTAELALAGRELNPNQLSTFIIGPRGLPGGFSFIPETLRKRFWDAQSMMQEAEKALKQEDNEENRRRLTMAREAFLQVQDECIALYFDNFYSALLQNRDLSFPQANQKRWAELQIRYPMARQRLQKAGTALEQIQKQLEAALKVEAGIPGSQSIIKLQASYDAAVREWLDAGQEMRRLELQVVDIYLPVLLQEYSSTRADVERLTKNPLPNEEAQKKALNSALQILEVRRQAAMILYNRLIDDLQSIDLPAMSVHVRNLREQLTRKMGQHQNRIRELNMLENTVASTLWGVGVTITELGGAYLASRGLDLMLRRLGLREVARVVGSPASAITSPLRLARMWGSEIVGDMIHGINYSFQIPFTPEGVQKLVSAFDVPVRPPNSPALTAAQAIERYENTLQRLSVLEQQYLKYRSKEGLEQQ